MQTVFLVSGISRLRNFYRITLGHGQATLSAAQLHRVALDLSSLTLLVMTG